MKNNNRITFYALLLTFGSIWTACSKSSSSSSSSRITLITQSSWKYDTAGIDLNKDGKIDIGDTSVPACIRDNIYQFNKDSTVVVNEGATTCNAGDPLSASYNWSLTTNQTVLASSDPTLAGGVIIYSLDANKLVVYKDTTILGNDIWYILSLKH